MKNMMIGDEDEDRRRWRPTSPHPKATKAIPADYVMATSTLVAWKLARLTLFGWELIGGPFSAFPSLYIYSLFSSHPNLGHSINFDRIWKLTMKV